MTSIVNRRWEKGLPHHEVSTRIVQSIQDIDDDLDADIKSGGDGDNGEALLFLLDEHIEQNGCCPGCGTDIVERAHQPDAEYVQADGKRYAIIRIDVDDEALRAGNFKFSPHLPDEKMSISGLVRFHLEGAVQHKIHMLKSNMKWIRGEFWRSPNIRKEPGYMMTRVTDDQGNEHHVQLPSGKKWDAKVITPAEGTWECKGSPTGLCWYCDTMDPSWICCVFCGDPNERK